jgi:hypothetical protein
MRTSAAMMILAVCGGCSTGTTFVSARPDKAMPVEVWTGGDDGLTQRVADAVRDEFKQSPLFTLTQASMPNSLRVTIPTHVGWKEVGSRSRVTYRVVFETGPRRIGERSGICWEDELAACARMVVKQATDAVSS